MKEEPNAICNARASVINIYSWNRCNFI